jgi:hypothetical protein
MGGALLAPVEAVDVVTFRFTGKSAIVAIVALAIAYIEITAWQFSRECAQLDRVKSDLEFWLRAGEMRKLVADLRHVDLQHLTPEQNRQMSERSDQLKVHLTSLTCADTFVGRYICQAGYETGEANPVRARDPAYFQLYRSTKGSWSFLDIADLARRAYSLSPRKCSLQIAPREPAVP